MGRLKKISSFIQTHKEFKNAATIFFAATSLLSKIQNILWK